jgi:hypothetical protein
MVQIMTILVDFSNTVMIFISHENKKILESCITVRMTRVIW